MANIKPTKLQMFNGLRRRPHYEEISQEINPDKTKIIYPNRDATRLRNDPRMTQMDGLGMFESLMEQQEATTREQRKETILADIAKDEGIGIKEVKSRPPPPPAPPPSQPASGSGANPRMPYADPTPGPSGSGANPRMFPPRMPYTFEFGAQDPQTDHEAEIAEARTMSKQQRMTKQERNDANMAKHLALQQDRMADLLKKKRQSDLDNRRTMPDEIFAEAEATKSESDKPIPKRKGRPTKKDEEAKKPAVKKEEPEEVKEIKKEEEIKRELRNALKKEHERDKSTPQKAMRERSKSRDAQSDPEQTPPRQKRRSKLERSRSRDAPPLPIPKAKAKAKGRPKKEYVEGVKEEVSTIEKRIESLDPESKHELKGPVGRPRSTSRAPQGASSSSSGNKPHIDSNSGLADIGRLKKSELLKAIIDHGFQGKQLVEIQKKTKSEIVLFIDQLIKDDRWR